MEEFLTHLLTKIVNKPERLKIEKIEDDNSLTFLIQTDQKDLSQVIGKKGRTIQAIRTLLLAYLFRNADFKSKNLFLKVEENKS